MERSGELQGNARLRQQGKAREPAHREISVSDLDRGEP
jgi:hypothetical protein